jgi:predicted PhzF superfamily epimerase YddE/YHI9
MGETDVSALLYDALNCLRRRCSGAGVIAQVNCPLEDRLPDAAIQTIAAEKYLPESAYFVPGEAGFHQRWFTSVTGVDQCA